MISFIFCYRNRPTHLNLTIPRIREVMGDKDYEMIVVEQDDDRPFERGQLFNEGAKPANGDILVFHDIDHYPTDNVVYWPEDDAGLDVFLPIKKIKYVYNDLTEKPENEIPSGYRKFKDGVDDDFFGGITAIRKEAFLEINGFSSLYRGWGFEDADFRKRIQSGRLVMRRSDDNLFLALDHPNSDPGISDSNLQHNMNMFQRWHWSTCWSVPTDARRVMSNGSIQHPTMHDGVLTQRYMSKLVESPFSDVHWIKTTRID